MEVYHVGDTYPPIDLLLTRNDVYVDPSTALEITVRARINGVHVITLSTNLTENVSIVVDDDGNNRVRLSFVVDDLDTAGIYQLQVYLTWAGGSETSPIAHEFKVVAAWV